VTNDVSHEFQFTRQGTKVQPIALIALTLALDDVEFLGAEEGQQVQRQNHLRARPTGRTCSSGRSPHFRAGPNDFDTARPDRRFGVHQSTTKPNKEARPRAKNARRHQ
jgi:hypothetical protein